MTTYLVEFLGKKSNEECCLYIRRIFKAAEKTAECVASNLKELASGAVVDAINNIPKIDKDIEVILKNIRGVDGSRN